MIAANLKPEQVEYRNVPGVPGYRVGNDGSVWSCIENHGLVRTIGTSWRPLKIVTCGTHYPQVTLCRGGKRHVWAVHRLVLTTFVGESDGQEARHLDGNKYNNALSNLCWGTRRENMADMIRHGTSPRGQRNGRVKLREEDVRAIRILSAGGWNTARIARWLGRPYWTIRNVVDGTRWSWVHGGHS